MNRTGFRFRFLCNPGLAPGLRAACARLDVRVSRMCRECVTALWSLMEPYELYGYGALWSLMEPYAPYEPFEPYGPL